MRRLFKTHVTSDELGAEELGRRLLERMTPVPNLEERLLAITAAIEPMERRGLAEEDGFIFVEAAEVLKTVRALLVEHGVVITPILGKLTREPALGGSGEVRPEPITQVDFTFHVRDVAGSPAQHHAWSVVVDGDESTAVSRAIPQALKSFLMALFLIPAVDPEPSRPTPAEAPPGETPAREAARERRRMAELEKPISEVQRIQIVAKARDEAGLTDDVIEEITWSRFQCRLPDLKRKDLNALLEAIKQTGNAKEAA